MTLQQRALLHALSQNGVQEIPRNSNAGPAVESYLKSVGLGKGFAWCMAFIYWCYQKASKETSTPNPLFRTAGVLAFWNNSRAFRQRVPQQGDIFIMDFGRGQGHAGIVLALLPNGSLLTIEGNTNDEGSREGFEVCIRHDRKPSQMVGFVRFN